MIPGLPDDLVRSRIIPRLPWLTRPIARTLSTEWCKALEHPLDYAKLTREVTFHRYHSLGTLIIYSRFEFILYNDEDKSKIKLPPHLGFLPIERALVCAGKVFLILVGPEPGLVSDPLFRFIFQLDIGAGLWRWQHIDSKPPRLSGQMEIASSRTMLVFVSRTTGDALHAYNARDDIWVSFTQYSLLPACFAPVEIINNPHIIRHPSIVQNKLLLLVVDIFRVKKRLVMLDIEARQCIRVIELPDQSHSIRGLRCLEPVLVNEHTILLFYRKESEATFMWVSRYDLDSMQWSRLNVVMPCDELEVLTVVLDHHRLCWYGAAVSKLEDPETRVKSYSLLKGRIEEEQQCFVWERKGTEVQERDSPPKLDCF